MDQDRRVRASRRSEGERTERTERVERIERVERVERVERPASAGGANPMPIGELARRAGVAASALRFYEAEGLIQGSRSASGRRQYPRDTLRRVAFLRAGQRVGLSLDELRQALGSLPAGRTPNKADWERLARQWQALLDERVALLQRLRDTLGGCIGCGCLSLKACALYNPDDAVARRGPGARRLMLGEPL